MKKIIKYIIYLLLVILYSCEFNPVEIPETNIAPLSEEEVSIYFELNPNVDTVKLFKNITTLQYNIDTNEKKLYKVEFYLDNERIGTKEDYNLTPYELEFKTFEHRDGIHKLTIKVYTSMNDGSLADQIGASGILFELNWPLVIDKTQARKLNITSIDSVDTGVKITWEKFDHFSFQHYHLSKTSPAFSGTQDLAIIYNPKNNYFIDTTYMEGMEVTYELNLNDNFLTEKDFLKLPQKPKIKHINGFEIEVSWEVPMNINILDYYYLHIGPTTSSIVESEKIYDSEIRSKRQTAFFGELKCPGIIYAPKSQYYINPYYLKRSETEYMLGDKMPLYKYIKGIPSTPFILLSNNGKIYKYNLSTGILKDSIQFNCELPDYFTVSNDGSRFGYSEDGKFFCRNTQDFSLIYTLSNTGYEIQSNDLYMFRTSNLNRLLTLHKNKIISIFNLETGNKIATKSFQSLSWVTARISPDGNYIITKEYDGRVHIVYYQIIGDQIVELGRVDDSELKYNANIKRPFGPNQNIYIVLPNKIEVRDGSDFSIKKTISVSNARYIDYGTMQAVCNNYSGSNLFDLETGDVIMPLYISGQAKVDFHSNYLICNKGRKLNLSNIE